MHLHPCCILVLAFFTPLETRRLTCDECNFPDQMWGEGIWYLHYPEGYSKVMAGARKYRLQIDYPKKLLRFYPPSGSSTKYEFVQDMEKDLMYRFTSSDDCKYVKTPPEFNFPSCVPSDYKERRNSPGIIRYDDKAFSPPRYRFAPSFLKMKDNDKCELDFCLLTIDLNSTLVIEARFEIFGYKLPNGGLQLPFFPNTSVCTESNLDLFILR